ncbi:MAG: MFS transporter [Candidatus Micrarchaeia archaeon]|jgi:MFS family permease
MLKRLYTINFLDAFIVGVITVLVPLLMLERGIDLTTIGFVFAAAPLAKAAIRLAAAAIADSLGDRVVYIMSSASDFLQSLAYLFSTTAMGFAGGKLLDGARESLIWSVNRPSLMAISPENKHFAFTNLLSGRLVYNALGSLAVGVLFIYGGYELPLLAIVALSAYLVYASLGLKNAHRAETHSKLTDFNPLGRSGKFYEIAGVFLLGSLFYSTAFYMLIPIYLSTQGFTLAEIGVFYAGYFLLQGLMLQIISHRKVGTRKAAYAGAAIYGAGLAGLVLAPHALIPLFFLLMSIGDAFLAILWEEMNYIGAKESKKRATDLSLLVTPSFFGNVLSAGVSGAAVALFGFAPFFAALAIAEAGFAAWCLRLSRMKG